MALQPLTPEEQAMAEQYLYLVDGFLRKNRLPADEYYDVVIFGYLAAVQTHFRGPHPPEKENFFGLAKVCMLCSLSNELHRQRQKKRRGDLDCLSLDYIITDPDGNEDPFYAFTADPRQDVQKQVEDRDLMQRALSVASPKERELLELICLGYTPGEIAQVIPKKPKTIYIQLCAFRKKARYIQEGLTVEEAKEAATKAKREYEATYRTARQEMIRTYRAAYYAARREEINAKQREYYAARREEINAKQRERRRKLRESKQPPPAV